ncbi:MAG: TetR/AcrR family transcriptional regulator [Pseudomonadales bacterium]|nr:TetR/AcrR family transcriptional regulator [Pseudomonadales bacterium]
MSRNPEATRERILKATVELLLAGTPAAVRMADIARRAGITRQALYLHFTNRTTLLIAATQFVDQEKNIDARLAPSRNAGSGEERLTLYIDAWGNYIPEIFGIARGLISVYDSDEAAAAAWDNRLAAVRHGCEAAVKALRKDGKLKPSPGEATDILCGLLSVELWKYWVQDCGWSQSKYIRQMQQLARQALIK